MPTNPPGYMTKYRAVLGPDGLLSFQSKFCAAITRVNRPPLDSDFVLPPSIRQIVAGWPVAGTRSDRW